MGSLPTGPRVYSIRGPGELASREIRSMMVLARGPGRNGIRSDLRPHQHPNPIAATLTVIEHFSQRRIDCPTCISEPGEGCRRLSHPATPLCPEIERAHLCVTVPDQSHCALAMYPGYLRR